MILAKLNIRRDEEGEREREREREREIEREKNKNIVCFSIQDKTMYNGIN